MYGLEHAGIGRYVENLVKELYGLDKQNQYLLLLRENQAGKWKMENRARGKPRGKWKIKTVDIPHYSVAEQMRLPKVLNKLDFDLAHFPHFNVPVFFRKPYVVTIHDLIKHTSRGMKTTTRNPLLYWAKYAGYKTVFGNAVRRAKKIIVPSKVVKEDLLKNYKIHPDKVWVIYEGVDEKFKSEARNSKFETIAKKYKIQNPYVIYTGSAYPHKNLERLVESIAMMNKVYQSIDSELDKDLNLVIVSVRNVFIDRLEKVVERHGMRENVKFLGFVEDNELAELYKNAKAFVFPSLAEGFGLPGLEAMAAGALVVCSDIPVFHEIYGDAATYFNPHDARDIAEKINELLHSNDTYHRSVVEKGKKQAAQFSWRKMAEETLKVYESVGG